MRAFFQPISWGLLLACLGLAACASSEVPEGDPSQTAEPGSPEPDGGIPEPEAVSYTHLTLPTICSV